MIQLKLAECGIQTQPGYKVLYILATFGLLLLSYCEASRPLKKMDLNSKLIDSIVFKIDRSYSFKLEELRDFQKNPAIYSGLLGRMHRMDNSKKVDCLGRFEDLGAAISDHPEFPDPLLVPYISNPIIVAGLVEFLGDKNSDIREVAADIIFKNVPDLYLRNHVPAVIDHFVAYPETPRAAQILAKTGSEKARAIIRSNTLIRAQDEMWTAQALAKLGDSLQEDGLIKKYLEEKAEGPKQDLALVLGFIGSPRTILTLARDLRNPMTYEWNQTALRSFRVHIIQGLSRAYPMEPLLWKPDGTPRDDGYYQKIEAWATAKLGVTWDRPRPTFLYEMDVPSPATSP